MDRVAVQKKMDTYMRIIINIIRVDGFCKILWIEPLYLIKKPKISLRDMEKVLNYRKVLDQTGLERHEDE